MMGGGGGGYEKSCRRAIEVGGCTAVFRVEDAHRLSERFALVVWDGRLFVRAFSGFGVVGEGMPFVAPMRAPDDDMRL